MKKRWLVADLITPQAENNLRTFDPVLRQLLFNRGLGTNDAAAAFLQGQPDFDTDALRLSGVAAAVQRISYAIEHQEPIAVYGDYDVDGVTATALLVQALERLGATVRAVYPK